MATEFDLKKYVIESRMAGMTETRIASSLGISVEELQALMAEKVDKAEEVIIGPIMEDDSPDETGTATEESPIEEEPMKPAWAE